MFKTSILNRFKKIDLAIGVLFLLTCLSFLFFNGGVSQFFFWIFVVLASIRLLILFKRKILWKTRNRLIFSSLFFVVTPIILVSIFFLFIVYIILAQYGVIIIDNMIKKQLYEYEKTADYYIALDSREKMVTGSRRWASYIPTDAAVIFYEKADPGGYEDFYRYPGDVDFSNFRISQFSKGYFKINEKFYLGVLKKNDRFGVLVSMHLNENFLNQISAISDFRVKLIKDDQARDKNSKIDDISRVASENRDILLFPWPYKFKYTDFDESAAGKPMEKENYFWLLIDYDKLFQKIRGIDSQSVQLNIQKFIYFLIGLFAFFIIISFFVGMKIIRVITRSINQISRGTERIRKGDFSVRIKIKSGDQLQNLAESFNEMASGIKRLLIDEKEKQRLEEELRIARSIQLKLLPQETFETREFAIAAVNIPAAEIAGDYFDYFYKEGHYLLVLVADVSGKGTSAAFYMAELKGIINYLQKMGMSPAALISECHESMSHSLDKITFITMNLARFLVPEKKFIFSRAGHTQALFYSAGKKKCEELYPEGVAIGLSNFSKSRIKEIEVRYRKGDILFLFSDGLSEIMNEEEEMLGVNNLKRLILENHTASVEEIKAKILDFSIQFSESNINRDDLTFIVLKIK